MGRQWGRHVFSSTEALFSGFQLGSSDFPWAPSLKWRWLINWGKTHTHIQTCTYKHVCLWAYPSLLIVDFDPSEGNGQEDLLLVFSFRPPCCSYTLGTAQKYTHTLWWRGSGCIGLDCTLIFHVSINRNRTTKSVKSLQFWSERRERVSQLGYDKATMTANLKLDVSNLCVKAFLLIFTILH